MLLRTFFLIFLFSVLAVTTLATTAFFSKTLLHERALSYVPAGYQLGLAQISAAFASGTFVTPPDASPGCVSNDTPCSFFSTQTISAPLQTAPSSVTACTDGTLTNCALNLQKQVIDEGRLGIQVVITIFDASKNPIVTRIKFLTLRTFRVAPYFAVIGERDGAVGDRSSSPEGENAGLAAGAAQSSTQIRIQYHDTTGANPDSEHDSWATQGWSSGNGGSSAWSP